MQQPALFPSRDIYTCVKGFNTRQRSINRFITPPAGHQNNLVSYEILVKLYIYCTHQKKKKTSQMLSKKRNTSRKVEKINPLANEAVKNDFTVNKWCLIIVMLKSPRPICKQRYL